MRELSKRAATGLVLVSLLLPAGKCGGGSGGGGGRTVIDRSDSVDGSVDGGPRVRCSLLPGQLPAGLDFVPGSPDRLLVANFSPSALLPFDSASSPPVIASSGPVPDIPPDSDGDGRADVVAPVLDGVLGVAPGLAFATASLLEEILFVNAESGSLLSFQVSTPGSFLPGEFPLLPPPGTSALRTALSTRACLTLPAGAVDSEGTPLAGTRDCGAGRFVTSFSSGVALAAGRLFVSTSNVLARAGTPDTVFAPGSVLVYELDLATTPPSLRPDPATTALYTSAFNPTHVTSVTTPGGRSYVLVTLTGPLGLVIDDPSTPDIEAGGIPLGEAAIDVIDPALPAVVASIPLGRAAPAFDRLAVDPGGRVAFVGASSGRRLYAIDLAALDAIPGSLPGVILDGSDARASQADARIFSADQPLAIPARLAGAPLSSCPGLVDGVAFAVQGDRLFATDFCDGTLAVVSVDLGGSPPVPVPRERFVVERVVPVAEPIGRPESLGRSRGPGALRTAPPGGAAAGDLFLLVGLEEGKLCRLESDSL